MMKKILGFLIIASVLLSTVVMGTVAPVAAAEETEKKFVVDGNLDVLYLSREECEDADSYYNLVALDPFEKADGVSYYPEYETHAVTYTAWDDDYVYIYVKVWDDELVDYDPDGAHAGGNSSAADSLEIWFDPDPNSQTHSFTYDENGNIIAETPKAQGDIKDGWYNQTGDATQGDIQVRLIAYDMERHDYHNCANPGYNGVTFGDWVKDPANFCTFTFENDPIELDGGTGATVSSGYGVEARFPRNNDSSGHYRFHIAVNNSADEVFEFYALATGPAWWMRFDTAWNINYAATNPFFAQSDEQLAAKKVQYTDSEYNLASAGGKLVKKIAALPTDLDEGDKAAVDALVAEYNALSTLDKGYVQYKNYDVLVAAVAAVGGEDLDKVEADKVIAMIDALTEGDAQAIAAARAAYNALTDTQKDLVTNLDKLVAMEATVAPDYTPGDVNADGSIDAKDALLVLQAAVKKVQLSDTQQAAAKVNIDDAIDAKDALLILQKAVKKIDKFPCEA